MDGETGAIGPRPQEDVAASWRANVHHCDRCGEAMVQRHCRIICPNCGNQLDCSDLTIYME